MKINLGIEKIQERLRESQAHGKEYKPFIRVQDFPSRGQTSRILGETTGRQHDLFSKLERACFLIFDYTPSVIDIREQYPLFMGETLQIAHQLGYKHPREVKTQSPIIMTTDFLLMKQTKTGIEEVARAVKTREDFEKPRTQEKLKIEKEYWKHHGIDWKIILEESINWTLVQNLETLRRLKPAQESEIVLMHELKELLLREPELERDQIFQAFEAQNELPEGKGSYLHKLLIKGEEIDYDITKVLI